jgi:putative phosphoesterase
VVIGVISDTHGLLRPEALDALRGSDVIVHAGDVGSRRILDDLARIAPVKAIRGNVDTGPWSRRLPENRIVEAAGVRLYVIHDVKQLQLNPDDERVGVVIAGHSHRATIDWRNGVLFLNPGSAGPRRFRLPVTLARLAISEGRIVPEIIQLSVT